MMADNASKIYGRGGALTTWYYQNGGKVMFVKEKVIRWTEP